MFRPDRLALVAMALTGTLLLASIAFAVMAPTPASAANLALGLAVAPVSAVLGLVIARRPSVARVGLVLAFLAFVVGVTVARETSAPLLAARPGDAAELAWLVALTQEASWWVLVAVALLLLSFPDGRLPGGRWRWVPPVAVAAAAITQVHGAFDSGPFRPPLENLARPFGPPPPWLEVLALVSFLFLLPFVLASAVSLVLRYRRSGDVARAQIKWLAVGGFGVALYPLVCGVEILATGSPGWISAAVGIAGLVGIPVATGIAMLRHDLYDVDKALAETAAWVLLSGILVTAYGALSTAAGVVLGQGSPVAAAAAAALCALALGPLRQRLGRAVDRRLYPRRQATIEALDALYRDASAGRAQPESIQAVLRRAMRDDHLVVGFRLPGTDEYLDPAGNPVAVGDGTLVELDGRAIGVLVPGRRGTSRELQREVARRATTLVEVVRLRLELSRALREVEQSRARLVQIGYEERRRLERDLHDGAQQRLVSLGLAIRLAQRHLDDGTVDLPGLLEDTIAQLSTAVAELRRLAQGIRPSSLDDGLETAVARLVQGMPVRVETELDAGSLPDDVATTAYFVISEALANAVKHADASRIGLRVARGDGHVVVRVTDDGRGGATLSGSSGLADRVAALGGSLVITSPVGRGTVVEAALPCAS